MAAHTSSTDHLILPWTPAPLLSVPFPEDLIPVRGEGSYIYVQSGARYLDGCSGQINTVLGHGRADIIAAMTEQLQQQAFSHRMILDSPVAHRFIERLLAHAPDHFPKVSLHTTGTAAVEASLVMCRQHFQLIGQPQRSGIISVENGYHGCSSFTMAVCGTPAERSWFGPGPGEFHRIPCPRNAESARSSLDALAELISSRGADTLAAFIFEPVMGMAGFIEPPEFWVRGVIELCHSHGIKVIADEMITGLGRTGAWFAASDHKVDAIVLGKGLTAGYAPLSAVLYDADLVAPLLRSDESVLFPCGSTMDGYPPACAAGLAVLEAIEREGLVGRAAILGERLRTRLQPLSQLGFVAPLRGRGLLVGIPLHQPGAPELPFHISQIRTVLLRLRHAGLLLMRGWSSTLKVAPPLTCSDEEIDRIAAILIEVLAQPHDLFDPPST